MSWTKTATVAGAVIIAGGMASIAMMRPETGAECATEGMPSGVIVCAPASDPDGRPLSRNGVTTAHYEGDSFGSDGAWVYVHAQSRFVLRETAIPQDLLSD